MILHMVKRPRVYPNERRESDSRLKVPYGIGNDICTCSLGSEAQKMKMRRAVCAQSALWLPV